MVVELLVNSEWLVVAEAVCGVKCLVQWQLLGVKLKCLHTGIPGIDISYGRYLFIYVSAVAVRT